MMIFEDALHELGGKTPDHWDSVWLDICFLCDCTDIDRLLESL